jgi:hypothetical protein
VASIVDYLRGAASRVGKAARAIVGLPARIFREKAPPRKDLIVEPTEVERPAPIEPVTRAARPIPIVPPAYVTEGAAIPAKGSLTARLREIRERYDRKKEDADPQRLLAIMRRELRAVEQAIQKHDRGRLVVIDAATPAAIESTVSEVMSSPGDFAAGVLLTAGDVSDLASATIPASMGGLKAKVVCTPSNMPWQAFMSEERGVHYTPDGMVVVTGTIDIDLAIEHAIAIMLSVAASQGGAVDYDYHLILEP